MKMMVDIARHARGRTAVSLTDVAERTRMSQRYMEQLAIGLRADDLIRGRAGKGGGYTLLQPPEEISVCQIIEAAIGPINVTECVLHPNLCKLSESCECRLIYQLLNQRITELLRDVSLADLIDPEKLQCFVQAFEHDDAKRKRRRKGETKSMRE